MDWCKDSHYVHNRETAECNQIASSVVKSLDTLQEWPKYITGVIFEARGVTDSKENTKETLKFEQSFEELDTVHQNNKQTGNHF